MTVTPERILAAAADRGLHLDPAAAERMADYLALLIKWNKAMNLVGPSKPEVVFDTLFVDSLYLGMFLETLPLPAEPVCLDLGSGAGLPGIPLRCFWERGEYHLIELREKRASFLRTALGRLRPARTVAHRGRAEEVATTLPPADCIVSRAFMPWRELTGFVRSMLAPDGLLVVLANDPAPRPDELPEGWALGGETSYPAAGKTRFFWSLSTARPTS